jgi:hypothetical protein
MVIIRGKEVKKRTIISIVEVKVLKKSQLEKIPVNSECSFFQEKIKFPLNQNV